MLPFIKKIVKKIEIVTKQNFLKNKLVTKTHKKRSAWFITQCVSNLLILCY